MCTIAVHGYTKCHRIYDCSIRECQFFNLNCLGLFIHTVTAARQHTHSQHTSSPLVDLILYLRSIIQILVLLIRFTCIVEYITPKKN